MCICDISLCITEFTSFTQGATSSKSQWPEYAVKVKFYCSCVNLLLYLVTLVLLHVQILSIPKIIALGRNCLDMACREIAALQVIYLHSFLSLLLSVHLMSIIYKYGACE